MITTEEKKGKNYDKEDLEEKLLFMTKTLTLESLISQKNTLLGFYWCVPS